MGGSVSVGRGRLHKEQIRQTVLIVVEPGDAGAHGFEIILFFGLCGILDKGDARRRADIVEADRNLSILLRRLARGLAGFPDSRLGPEESSQQSHGGT